MYSFTLLLMQTNCMFQNMTIPQSLIANSTYSNWRSWLKARLTIDATILVAKVTRLKHKTKTKLVLISISCNWRKERSYAFCKPTRSANGHILQSLLQYYSRIPTPWCNESTFYHKIIMVGGAIMILSFGHSDCSLMRAHSVTNAIYMYIQQRNTYTQLVHSRAYYHYLHEQSHTPTHTLTLHAW